MNNFTLSVQFFVPGSYPGIRVTSPNQPNSSQHNCTSSIVCPLAPETPRSSLEHWNFERRQYIHESRPPSVEQRHVDPEPQHVNHERRHYDPEQHPTSPEPNHPSPQQGRPGIALRPLNHAQRRVNPEARPINLERGRFNHEPRPPSPIMQQSSSEDEENQEELTSGEARILQLVTDRQLASQSRRRWVRQRQGHVRRQTISVPFIRYPIKRRYFFFNEYT